MKKTILIAGASVGWGHMQAANNVANALLQSRADLEIEAIDIFNYVPKGIRCVYKSAWRLASCHMDKLYGTFYRRTMSKTTGSQVMEKLVQTAAQRLNEAFGRHEVSVYVATQGVAASVGSLLKDIYGYKLCIVATDFVLNSLQVFPNVDSYYLPPGCQMTVDEPVSENLTRKTWITGIPIASDFAVTKDKEDLRKRFGLSPNLTTALVSFGGAGLKAEKHIHLFGHLLEMGLPLQFIVLAGRNTRFAKTMRDLYGDEKYKGRIKVYDYLNSVSDFYAVADLFIGKAGGLTISEALAAKLPIIIIDKLPGQEDFNVQVILSKGLGLYAHNLTELAEWIKSFLSNGTSASWRSSLDDFARPKSSIVVADHIAAIA